MLVLGFGTVSNNLQPEFLIEAVLEAINLPLLTTTSDAAQHVTISSTRAPTSLISRGFFEVLPPPHNRRSISTSTTLTMSSSPSGYPSRTRRRHHRQDCCCCLRVRARSLSSSERDRRGEGRWEERERTSNCE
ncbi:hypothetical protein RchiOBHm_Chr5g0049111 [Rosa chinensis]|uniref:Uncharacterized protein n=1 Tax=Rosa chinensis TaxID=74649 RepID=A0A2P6QET1_ROSCH|nr:hypothetical protein RchiOBHm_Chr5g0049111 [Rosa chinensis]